MSNLIANTLLQALADARVFLYGGIRTLPITLLGTTLLLGTFTGHFAMMFFTILFMAALLLASGINKLVEDKTFAFDLPDECNLFLTSRTVQNGASPRSKMIVSPWLAGVSFFIGYILTNAVKLYNRQPAATSFNVTADPNQMNEEVGTDTLETRTMRRTTQSILAITMIMLFAISILYYRTSCEPLPVMVLTVVLFGFLGNGAYYLLGSAYKERVADLFGMVNRLLPPSAIANQPIACVSVPSP